MDIETTTPSIQTEPEPDWILEGRGYQLLDDGKFEQGRAIFSELALRAPSERRGHAGLAWTAEHQWRWHDAIRHWEACIALDDDLRDNAIARKAACHAETGQVREAHRLLASVAYRPEASDDLANLIATQEPYPAGRQAWEICIDRFPGRIESYLGKVRLLFQRESYDEVEAYLGDVLQAFPDSVSARALQAECSVALKNWPVAAQRWRDLIASSMGAEDALNGYVRYLAVIGDRAALDTYLAQFSEKGIAAIQCLLEYHLARDDYGAAAEQARLLAEAEPERPVHRLRQADILLRHGAPAELQAALWILKGLYRRFPDSIWVKLRLANALVRAGADRQAEIIIKTFPPEDRRADAEKLRAWRQHLHGREVAAQESWKSILDRSFVPAIHAPEGRLIRMDKNHAELRSGDILLFSVMRDEAPRLSWFLNYYRNLGVEKFIIVDNDSSDGTSELLLQQPDVVLYRTSDRYGMSAWGVRWINALIEKHGRRNWCIYVDADEALIYPDSETIGLRALTQSLSAKGQQAMLAPLLDMYPTMVPEARDIEQLQQAYCYFDKDLHFRPHSICPYREVFGGVRFRLFQGYQSLAKVPLVDGSSGVRFLISTHQTTPVRMADVTGALLHYHLINILQPEYRSLLDDAIERREFPSASLERLRSREMLPRILSEDSLLGKESVRFESTRQLVELGLMSAAETGRRGNFDSDVA